jgi:hypothetical protein
MHESHVATVQPRPPPPQQHTTWIHKVFGGVARSQLECIGVKYESSIFEPFLDLSLEIFRCATIRPDIQCRLANGIQLARLLLQSSISSLAFRT